MTAQPQYPGYPTPAPNPTPAPAPTPAAPRKDARTVLEPFREWGALALLAATAVFGFFGFLEWLLHTDTFGATVDSTFGAFGSLLTLFFPLVAVLLAVVVKPVTQRARLVVIGALVLYAAAVFFGVLSMLIGFVHEVGITGYPVSDAFISLLERLVWLGLLGFAGFLVLRVYTALYYTPRPAAPPAPAGAYGYPAGYGQPGYPQQPAGYPQQPGYPAGYPAGYPQNVPTTVFPPAPQVPSAPPAPAPGYPTGYPTAYPAPGAGQPAPGQPAPGQPSSAPPAYPAPSPADPNATQVWGGATAPPADSWSGASVPPAGEPGSAPPASPYGGYPYTPAPAGDSDGAQVIPAGGEPSTEPGSAAPAPGEPPTEPGQPRQDGS